ncbi:zinc-dependent peptidase [Salinisphaera sp. SPP-AMP-43]|uniref:zinc-dependent peptidase n=1 Tax=Salinisphaera sp. SPP-AMP-43 TaxID=3121288 RepID=UPI003C6DF2A0
MNWFTSLLVALAALAAVALLVVVPARLKPEQRLSARQRRRLARLLPWHRRLDARRWDRLCRRTARVLSELTVLDAEGQPLADNRQLAIAGQIGLLCLGAQPTETRLPAEIVVHADGAPQAPEPQWTGVIEDIGELATGQPWQTLRLHLAWPAVAAALAGAETNPVVRELARLQDFSAPMSGDATSQSWKNALENQRRSIVQQGGSAMLRPADDLDTDAFFGRAAELFFQRGDALARTHPELYALLAAYFDLETARSRPSGHRTPAISGQS